MKQICFTIILATVLFYQTAFAQDQPSKTVFRNNIAINTLVVLDGNFFPFADGNMPLQLIYKRVKNESEAMRLGLTFQGRLQNYNNQRSYLIADSIDYTVALRAGYEWNRPIKGRFSAVYGVDLIPSFTKKSFETRTDEQDFFTHGFTERKTYSIKGRPFAGINFSITDRLQVYLEAGIEGWYSLYNKKDDLWYVNKETGAIDNPPGYNWWKYQTVGFRYVPVSGVYFNYAF
ncbi:hypothetical protein H9Q13_11280 [Pontibacter sp. JH31]|uniref:DUF3575 domain-containing protein n=1 Tax=Pontibacter aquaedesilientis TaxID=2766980 RepID=A0ABR7XHI1_9BACT|nr:hypothetical protein [Pontibacter aquaedesilientis]MBD1397747.1 hypothetical protein [Pontibacter aquaedesilientis]